MWYSRSVTLIFVLAAAARPWKAATAAPASASATASPADTSAVCRFLFMTRLRGCGELGLVRRLRPDDTHLMAAPAEEDSRLDVELEPARERRARPAFAGRAAVADGGERSGEGGDADHLPAHVTPPPGPRTSRSA